MEISGNNPEKERGYCMKRKWIGIRIVLSLCAALGWWGLLYPELTLTPDTVRITEENEDGEISDLPLEWSFDSELYRELLNAEPDSITLRSRLFTNIGLFWEALHGRK